MNEDYNLRMKDLIPGKGAFDHFRRNYIYDGQSTAFLPRKLDKAIATQIRTLMLVTYNAELVSSLYSGLEMLIK